MRESFKNLYIEGYGVVKVGSLGTIIGKKGKMKPNNQNTKGYYRVHLGKHTYSVHRLVATAFIPNISDLPEVNHKDGNKANNSVDNLEWVTGKQNIIHAIKNNLFSSKLLYEDITNIKSMYRTGLYTYEDLAKIYNVSYSNIGYIIRNDSWKCSLGGDNN